MIVRLKKSVAVNNTNQGFTLIEFIIYIGIVAVVLLGAFNWGWEIIYGNIKSQAIREVQQNTRFAMEKISEGILSASSTNNPTPGNSANSLSLKMQDLSLDPTLFEVVDGKLKITQGGSGPYELTNDRVRVTNLQFSNLSYENTPGTIRIQIAIEHVNPNNLSQYEASLSTEGNITIRF